ncbi:MAG: DUF134 domain-containing protein [Desulfuromonadales bacterium]
MARPRKQINCSCPHRAGYSAVYKPAGTPLKDMEVIHLGHEELEALHQCDGKGKSQIEAGLSMGVSRGTVQRLLASARCKVAQALVGQKALAVSGGGKEKEVGIVSGEQNIEV